MIINKNIFYVDFKIIDNPKANIIISHGLGESSQDYIDLAECLNKSGYNVLLYDIRGHGKTMGKRGDIKNFHYFIEDLLQLVLFVKQHNNDKIFLLGHSAGGCIVNNYVTTYHNVDGVIISSTPAGIWNDKSYFFNYIKYLKYPLYLFNFKKIKIPFYRTNKKIFSNEEKFDPYRLEYLTPRLIRNILILSVKHLNKNLAKYSVPVLLLHNLKDRLVPYLNSEFLFSKIPISDKKIKLYDHFAHNLFRNIDQKIVIDDVIGWLEQKI